MSLHTVVEVVLHFESFRNIDLFHQGLYHLKTRLHRGDGENRLPAAPLGVATYPLPSSDQPKPKSARTDHHHLIPAHVVEEHCTFSTRSFLIRYCEEEVELNDAGEFRIELHPDDEEVPLVLEVDLMFADLTEHGGADRFGEQPDVDSTEFKSVSTQTFQIHGVEKGIHAFTPIVFDEFHFCLANLTVHSALVDFRLRLRPLSLASARSKTTASRATGGRSASVTELSSAAKEVPSTQNAALSLAECLFSPTGLRSSPGPAGLDQQLTVVAELYGRLLGLLGESYSDLSIWFKDICTKCLSQGQREALADAVEVPPLDLPYGMGSGVGTLQKHILAAKLGPDANGDTIATHLAYDMNKVSCQILDLWHKAVNIMTFAYREATSIHRLAYEPRVRTLWSINVAKDATRADVSSADTVVGVKHENSSDSMRQKAMPSRRSEIPYIEDLSLMPKRELQPIMFEERYQSKKSNLFSNAREEPQAMPSAPKGYRGVHLFVLVHGFQGNSFDMRLMKNNIALLYPDAIFLCSNSNEDNTEGDMNEMAIRLAQEVVNYICDWCPGSALGRLSFVAHSIGGIILRAALPLLQEYQSKMYTILTYASPHLGFFGSNSLAMPSHIQAGLWVLKKWRKSQCLEQLSMTDCTDQKESFMYKLSKTKGLEYFKSVILVSSWQDSYAPFESARIEIGSNWKGQADKEIFTEMARNIWEPIAQERVCRLDVNYVIVERNLDSAIGRAAHIQFLECQPVMKMIIQNFSSFFR
eukprot:gnl/TRDRNA2_/TRDRNA2_187147_c0_seq1.p1 gnl/TRDRNA2_/TRDRNA2_187147_c0~~gnl/TRDRNA2_/TRDRNA2_187147_c0_seq1.p1  ORF type:complete len:756 (+),score=128.22 gnl/TRDRNA2_/TRDRNA2_187147_c0_seq1:72-2339(+)